MNYTLHQLEVFLKVTETKSITKAAEVLNLTQPAVSIQLKNFQQQFDIALTETTGRTLQITDFGREIALAAENILREVHEINYKAESYKGLLTGRLRVASVSTGKYVMPYFLANFLKKHPNIELQLDVTNKQKVVRRLEENTVDFALVTLLPNRVAVDSLPIMPNYFKLFGPKPPTNESKIDLKTLANLPLIYRESGSGTRITMENYLSNHGIAPRKLMELNSNEAIKQAILSGLGYSIMSVFGWKNEALSGLVNTIDLPHMPLKNTWHLVWRKEKILSPVARAYLAHLKQHQSSIIADNFSWINVLGINMET